MPQSDSEVEVGLRAETGDAVEAFKKFGEGVDELKGHFGELGESAEKMMGAFSGIGAGMLAGLGLGAVAAEINHAIESISKATFELDKMSNMLGITMGEAKLLGVELGVVGSSMESYSHVVRMITMRINQNEQAFRDAGVEVRDHNGKLLETTEIISNLVNRLDDFKAGEDRNIMAMRLAGRGYQELIAFQRLHMVDTDRLKDLQEQLDHVVGEESVQATLNYRTAMAEANMVTEASEKVLADAFMPVAENFADWMSNDGPGKISIFKTAVQVMAAGIQVLSTTFQIAVASAKIFGVEIYDAIKGMVNKAADEIGYIASRIGEFFTTLKEAATEGPTKIQDVMERHNMRVQAMQRDHDTKVAQESRRATLERLADEEQFYDKLYMIEANGKKALEQIINGPKEPKHKKPGNEKATQEKGDTPPESRMSEFENGLTAYKLAYQQEHELRELGKADELEFWQSILHNLDDGSQDYQAVWKKVMDLQISTNTEARKQTIAAQEKSLDEQHKGYDASVAQTEQHLRKLKELNQISDTDEVLGERALAQAKLDADLEYFDALAKLHEDDKVKHQGYLAQKAEAQAQFNGKVAQLDDALAEAQKKKMDEMFRPVTEAFSKSITGMIQGTITFQKALANIWQSILGEFVNQLVKKMIDEWVKKEVANFMTSQAYQGMRSLLISAGLAKDTAAETTATTATVTEKKAEAAAVIPAEAAQAAGAAASAVAGTPIVGPSMAAAAYAATMAMVMSGLGVASASGGYDIPAGLNPLVQAHQKEMILPDKYADVIRGMASSGSSGDNGVNLHFHGGMMVDPKGFERWLKTNASTAAPALRQLARNFSPARV